jgi:hypothetical protein
MSRSPLSIARKPIPTGVGAETIERSGRRTGDLGVPDDENRNPKAVGRRGHAAPAGVRGGRLRPRQSLRGHERRRSRCLGPRKHFGRISSTCVGEGRGCGAHALAWLRGIATAQRPELRSSESRRWFVVSHGADLELAAGSDGGSPLRPRLHLPRPDCACVACS